MAKRSRVQQRKLKELEDDFEPLLLVCLRESAEGRWGMFGQNDHADPEGKYLNWPEAKRLEELAREIKSIRSDLGESNPKCERYLELRAQRGSYVPGEPKLAATFLGEIDAADPSE